MLQDSLAEQAIGEQPDLEQLRSELEQARALNALLRAMVIWHKMVAHPGTAERLKADPIGTYRTLAHTLAEVQPTPAGRTLAARHIAQLEAFEVEHPEFVRPMLRPLLAAAVARSVAKLAPRRIIPAARSSLRSGSPRKSSARATVGASSGSSSGDPPRPSDDDPRPLDRALCESCGRMFEQPPGKGRRRRHCSNACRQYEYRARKCGVKSKRRRLGDVGPLTLTGETTNLPAGFVGRLARLVEIYQELPEANGSTPRLRAEFARLSRVLVDERAVLKAKAIKENKFADKRAVDAAWRRAGYLASDASEADVVASDPSAGFRDVDGSWVSARTLRSVS
jgi:hypothetical protein